MSVVVCKLPSAGLGNQLFPLMNAFVFAKLNNLPIIVTGYNQLKLGPYLRKEKSKRRYSGYFTFQKNFIGEYFDKQRIKSLSKKLSVVYESPVQQLDAASLTGKLFVFEKMPTYHDLFMHLKPHRQLVKALLLSVLNPWIKSEVGNTMAPVLGVHIRMGDFRKLKAGEAFKGGHVRTPETYFVNTIKSIRAAQQYDVPVTVFTDGYKNEFEELFTLSNVQLAEGNSDIVDLLLLSKSQIIVTTTGSTFSYWSGFLSDAPIILHPGHIHQPVRVANGTDNLFEGAFDEAIIQSIVLTK